MRAHARSPQAAKPSPPPPAVPLTAAVQPQSRTQPTCRGATCSKFWLCHGTRYTKACSRWPQMRPLAKVRMHLASCFFTRSCIGRALAHRCPCWFAAREDGRGRPGGPPQNNHHLPLTGSDACSLASTLFWGRQGDPSLPHTLALFTACPHTRPPQKWT